MTPMQIEIAERRKRFHEAIAERAASIEQKEYDPHPIKRAESPPLAPTTAPKTRRDSRFKMARSPGDQSGWYHCMWFYDLMQGSEGVPSRITTKAIQLAVCEHYGIRYADLISHRRFAKLAFPRQVGMYLCSILTERALTEIGRYFGGRDHSTVYHARRKIGTLRLSDLDIDSALHKIAKMVGGTLS